MGRGGTEQYRTDFWTRLAYLCRYGKLSIVEAMEMPQYDVVHLLEAVNKLIADENRTSED